MVTERALINALILVATLIGAPFIISSALESGDFVPFLVFAGAITLLLAFFVIRDSLCFAPVLCGSMALSLNFLPIPLDGSHAAGILLILYYFTGYILIRQKPVKLGPPHFFWPMMVILGIMLYHNHTITAQRFGGEAGATEGVKPAILLYIIYITYFCAINVRSPSVNFLAKTPLYVVVFTAISTIPFALSTVIPGIAPYLHLITNKVNVQAYTDSVSNAVGGDQGIGRLGALAGLGIPTQAYLLCRFPLATWLRPERWWLFPASLCCLVLCVASGYRNTLFSFMFQAVVILFCQYTWRSMILPLVLGLGLVGLVVASSSNLIPIPLNKLPLTAQRSLSFLPGDWDPEAIASAASSNDFRKNIIDIYEKEYLYRSPWIGMGYNVDSKTYNALLELEQSPLPGTDVIYVQGKAFIEAGAFHTGWISMYNAVGIIGSVAFIALVAAELWTAGVFVFGPKTDRRSSLYPLYVWTFTMITTLIVGFFTVFGEFAQAMTQLLIDGIVLSHLIDLRRNREVSNLPSEQEKGSADFSRSGEYRYGYSKY
jgi:hypothetical protein